MNASNYQTPFRHKSSAADFRKQARAALTNRWFLAIGVGLLVLIFGGSGSISSFSINLNFRNLQLDDTSVRKFIQMLQQDFLGAMDHLVTGVIGTFFFTIFMVTSLLSLVMGIFVGSPVSVGYARFNLDLIDGKQETGVGTLFQPFNTCYWKSIGVKVLVGLITTAVGLVAAVIPIGLICILAFGNLYESVGGMLVIVLLTVITFLISIAACVAVCYIQYQYSLCTYILAEYPTLSVTDVLRNSRILMKGNKWRLFCLEFSFIGWMLLAACCTCSLGTIVVAPYMNVAVAAFYDEISQRSTAKEVEFPSINPDDYFPQ